MKQVIFMCDDELYKQAKMALPVHGQMSTYLRGALSLLVKDPEKAISMIDEVSNDVRGTLKKAD